MAEGFESIAEQIHAFAADRDWDQFHTPRNLALALAGEVGELAAELRWEPEGAAPNQQLRSRLADEAADILIFLIRFCQVSDINLVQAAGDKLLTNQQRYPAAQARGRADKYTAYAPNTRNEPAAQTPSD